MKIPVKYIILVFILIATALIYSGYRLGQSKIDRALQTTIDAQNDQIQKHITRIGDDSVFIAQKDTEILSQREAIKRGDIERKELRALNLKQVSEINRLNLRVDTLLSDISHNGQIIDVLNSQITSMDTRKDTLTMQKAILLPFEFHKQDEWLTLKGNFNSIGKLDLSLKMNLSLDVWTGQSRKTKEYTTLITTDSPYINVIGIKSQKYDLPKPKPYGIGLHIGYGVGKSGLTPVVSAGLNYNLIRF